MYAKRKQAGFVLMRKIIHFFRNIETHRTTNKQVILACVNSINFSDNDEQTFYNSEII